jgi:tRNA-dihydrouridine synthase B
MNLRIGDLELDGPTVLAPMAGYTDARFRRICRQLGCSLVFTEMVSAEGLMRSVKSTRRLIRIEPGERPVALQLYGHDPVRLGEAAARAEELVQPDLIDVNMGCPARKVVRKGSGVALMRDVPRAARIIEEVHAAASCPITAKIRSGWSHEELNALEMALALQDAGCSALTLHARPRTQLHSGPVDHDLIARIHDTLRIPVIGNGGVVDGDSARQMMEATGVEAVMIGRAAIGNPWVFRRILDGLEGRSDAPPSAEELHETLLDHLDGLITSNHEAGIPSAESRACSHFRGHLVRYSSGRPASVAFRRKLNTLRDRATVVAAVDELLGAG